jgi:hypothetical protein
MGKLIDDLFKAILAVFFLIAVLCIGYAMLFPVSDG